MKITYSYRSKDYNYTAIEINGDSYFWETHFSLKHTIFTKIDMNNIQGKPSNGPWRKIQCILELDESNMMASIDRFNKLLVLA